MSVLLDIILFFRADRLIQRGLFFYTKMRIRRIEKSSKQIINFVPQGSFDFDIMGPVSKFKIHPTSHIKSGTFIECSGGVSIGKYFHVGRGLTIFSSNHNWRSSEFLPYDSESILAPVVIGDGVWCGANVTITPGATIGDGVVIAAGSVVVGNIPAGKVYGGNPAKEIASRDIVLLNKLLSNNKFF
ncbi:acyltransferase [Motilimonas cestriensis]|uniref:acyltransferase n=1 Tax=Motilimonas cestriensis TaxID=2742685 RepID=UPI003DA5CE5C